jgi:S1-C subfamily serine protease
MQNIKLLCLICFSTIFFSCTLLNISATDNKVIVGSNNEPVEFETAVKNSQDSIVLLSISPFEDPTVDISQNGVCSGVIVDEIGHVLTNYHCVHKQKSILTYYYDREDWGEYKVEIVGTDPLADLALLKIIDSDKKLTPLKFAKDTEKLEVGTDVFALGHPMGMAWTVTKGIISSNTRYARHPYIHALQTDAAINKGNSGGPLLNMKGEIVGINALMISRISESAGVGIAIRGDIVQKSLKSMLKTGTVSRPAVGIQIMSLGHPRQRKVVLKKFPDVDPDHIPNVSGMFVSNATDEDLPKGIKKHDTVIGINGELFNDGVKFSNLLEKYKVGDKVTLVLVRKGRYMLVDVVLREFPVDLTILYPEIPMFPPKKKGKIPKN